jgi:hypothetical protein
MNNEDKRILTGIIESCLTINPSIFIPYLMDKMVLTNMPNKTRFYSFYKHMINCLNCNSNKILHYKWERINWGGNKLSLVIYDSIHKYPRLTFVIEKINGKLHIETLPF